jgi:hypothetical protein
MQQRIAPTPPLSVPPDEFHEPSSIHGAVVYLAIVLGSFWILFGLFLCLRGTVNDSGFTRLPGLAMTTLGVGVIGMAALGRRYVRQRDKAVIRLCREGIEFNLGARDGPARIALEAPVLWLLAVWRASNRVPVRIPWDQLRDVRIAGGAERLLLVSGQPASSPAQDHTSRCPSSFPPLCHAVVKQSDVIAPLESIVNVIHHFVQTPETRAPLQSWNDFGDRGSGC